MTSNLCRSTSNVMRSMPIRLPLCPLPALKNGCHTLATTDAHRFQAVARVAPLHFVQQSGKNASTGGRNGMAKRNAGAVDVEFVPAIELPFLEYCKHLRGKGFVQLDPIENAPAQARACKYLGDRWHRPNAHIRRVHTSHSPSLQEGHGLQTQLVQLIASHNQTH